MTGENPWRYLAIGMDCGWNERMFFKDWSDLCRIVWKHECQRPRHDSLQMDAGHFKDMFILLHILMEYKQNFIRLISKNILQNSVLLYSSFSALMIVVTQCNSVILRRCCGTLRLDAQRVSWHHTVAGEWLWGPTLREGLMMASVYIYIHTYIECEFNCGMYHEKHQATFWTTSFMDFVGRFGSNWRRLTGRIFCSVKEAATRLVH